MLTFSQDQFCPFRTSCRLGQIRKSPKSFKRFSEMAFKNTLLKVFDISKKNPITLNP